MLRIARPLYEAVIAHCRSQHPKEACGLLAGEGMSLPKGQERAVCAVYPMANTQDSPIGYALDPREQLRVLGRMRQRNQHMLGVYHSHTASEAFPSSVDVSLAVSPDISYVVVSLKNPNAVDFKSFRIDGSMVTSEAVRVVGSGLGSDPKFARPSP
jgi:proteasome lid subunit RPN8/RPN11